MSSRNVTVRQPAGSVMSIGWLRVAMGVALCGDNSRFS